MGLVCSYIPYWNYIVLKSCGLVVNVAHAPPWYSFMVLFHGTLFPSFFRADGRCHAVQARLCRKCCGHVISLGPYLLSMTSLPSAPVAVPGFSSFHFCFAPSDKRTF